MFIKDFAGAVFAAKIVVRNHQNIFPEISSLVTASYFRLVIATIRRNYFIKKIARITKNINRFIKVITMKNIYLSILL